MNVCMCDVMSVYMCVLPRVCTYVCMRCMFVSPYVYGEIYMYAYACMCL